jgi:hypothetical protein
MVKLAPVNFLRVIAIVIPLVVGSFIFCRVSRSGLAVYADSVTYICGARSIREGHGYTMQTADGSFERINLYPPLYSFFLAAASFPDRDVIATARKVHLILLLISLGLVMLFAGYSSSGSPSVIFLAGMSWVFATDLISFECIVLSESLFMMLAVLSVFLLYSYLRFSKLEHLVMAAVATALTWLSRYAGAAWVWSGMLCLLLFSHFGWRRRLMDICVFFVLASGMNLYWIWRNLQGGQSAFGRSIHLTHFYGREQAESLLTALRFWTWRLTTHHQSAYLGLYMVLLAVILVSMVWIRTEDDQEISQTSLASKLVFVYANFYLVFLVFCAVFFQGDLFSDSTRILIPFHLLLLLFIILHVHGLLRKYSNVNFRLLAWVVTIACIVGGSRAVMALIHDSGRPESLIYAAPEYRQSATIRAVLKMPLTRLIYTNLDYPITLVTGRECYTIPTVIDNDTQYPNPNYDSEMNEMSNDIVREGAVLVYFKHGDGWLVYPSLDKILARIPLQLVAAFDDGSIWQGRKPN